PIAERAKEVLFARVARCYREVRGADARQGASVAVRVAGRGLLRAARGFAVVEERTQHASVDDGDALVRDALAIERHRSHAIGQRAVVRERERRGGDDLAELVLQAASALVHLVTVGGV